MEAVEPAGFDDDCGAHVEPDGAEDEYIAALRDKQRAVARHTMATMDTCTIESVPMTLSIACHDKT